VSFPSSDDGRWLTGVGSSAAVAWCRGMVASNGARCEITPLVCLLRLCRDWRLIATPDGRGLSPRATG